MGIFGPKKYMDVRNVRLFYDEKTNQIRLTSSDPRIEGGLNLRINSGRQNEIAIRNALIKEGVIQEDFQSPLPTHAVTPKTDRHNPWAFPIGQGTKGTVFWKIESNAPPHLVVLGSPGSGKTVLTQNLIAHASKHSDEWEVMLGSPQPSIDNEVVFLAHHLNDSAESIQEIHEMLESLIQGLEEDTAPARRILVVIENYDHIFETAKNKIGYTNMDDKMAYAKLVLEDIAILIRAGRSAGIHLVIESFLDEEALKYLNSMNSTTIALGRLYRHDGMIAFGTDVSHRAFEHKSGRGLMRIKGELEPVQVFSPVVSMP